MRYSVYSVLIVFGFVFMEWRGLNLLPTGRRAVVPASMRTSPGGYRSYQSWSSRGFHGGK